MMHLESLSFIREFSIAHFAYNKPLSTYPMSTMSRHFQYTFIENSTLDSNILVILQNVRFLSTQKVTWRDIFKEIKNAFYFGLNPRRSVDALC